MLVVNVDERASLEDIMKHVSHAIEKEKAKPSIDAYLIMDDIMEKLKLVSYEKY